jgi:hypothetical protein
LEYAEEGDIADGNNEYAISNDGDGKPLAEGDNHDNEEEYAKDGNIANDNKNYALGNVGVNKHLAKGDNKYDTLSVARA